MKEQPLWAKEIASWMDSPHAMNAPPSHETCRICFETLKEVHQVLQNQKVPDAKTLWKERTGLEHPSNEQVDSIRMFTALYTFHIRTFDLLTQHSQYTSNHKPNSSTRPLDSKEQREVSDLILQLRSIGKTALADLITTNYPIGEAEIEKWHLGIEHIEIDFDDIDDETSTEEIVENSKPDDTGDEDEDTEESDAEVTEEQKAAIGLHPESTGPVNGYTDKYGDPIILQGTRNFAEGIELLLRMQLGNHIVDHWCWKDPNQKKDGLIIRLLQSGAPLGSGINENSGITDEEITSILMDQDAIDDVDIAYLELKTRDTNTLEGLGFLCVGDLKDMTVAELSIRGLPAAHNGGDKCELIKRLRVQLARLGRKLPDGDLERAIESAAKRSQEKKRKKARKKKAAKR